MSSVETDRDELHRNLRKELANVQLVDAHEHLPNEKQWLAQEADFSILLGYVRGDLIRAGMPEDALSPGKDSEEKWERMREFWPYVRNMGSGSLCRRAISMFCDVDDLDTKTIPIIHSRLQDYMKPGIYQRLLKDEYNIAACVNVVFFVTERSSTGIFAPILYTSSFAMPQKRSDIVKLAEAADQEIYSLNTYIRALDVILERG